MKLKDMLRKESVIAELKSRTRDGVLRELVEVLPHDIHVDKDRLVKVLIERESHSSTALPGKVAIPHGRLEKLDHLVMSFGRHQKGVPFGAEDGPSKLFFLLVAPMNSAGEHLKALARIARLCRNPSLRERLLKDLSGDDLFKTVISEDERY